MIHTKFPIPGTPCVTKASVARHLPSAQRRAAPRPAARQPSSMPHTPRGILARRAAPLLSSTHAVPRGTRPHTAPRDNPLCHPDQPCSFSTPRQGQTQAAGILWQPPDPQTPRGNARRRRAAPQYSHWYNNNYYCDYYYYRYYYH